MWHTGQALSYVRPYLPVLPGKGADHGRRTVDFLLHRQRPDDARILLASATATSLGGFVASILRSQGSSIVLHRRAWWTTAEAPRSSNRRRSRCPILLIRPSRCLPAVEASRGVSPIQAAKSPPRRKVSIGGAKA